MITVGVDIGGTFTDFIVLEGGELRIYKTPSTPNEPSDAFLTGVEALEIAPTARYVHGSTVATNAVLERRGVRAALITTAGFRDILELGRQTRTHLYALTPSKPEPVIPRERCFEVPERVDKDGNVLTPLDEQRLSEVLAEVATSGAEALAVVFLFSFVRPEHEQKVAERARAMGFSVSLSSEILPEYREYERASTTSVNAYVAPLIDRYLSHLDRRLSERGRERLQIMQSNGGVISVATARQEAVRTVLSGPAGGVVGAWKVAARAGFSRILTFDMGGTSTDVALIDGEPALSPEGGTISGLPIRIPMLDIHTVGAGGGSIGRVEPGGGLRVGPESAGADPGPAAYGKGDRPTVTDANLFAGRLRADRFLAGRMTLQPERSREAIQALGEALGLKAEPAAEGILRVANAQMARALRRVSVERGHDPRDFCLVAFGGSGPLHACELAEELRIPQVLLPRYPGILSALGMLLSDIRKEYSRTVMRPLPALSEVEPRFVEMEQQAFREMRDEGVEEGALELSRWLDLRYVGQSYELTIPVSGLPMGEVRAAFDDAHRRRYGTATPDAACEIVNLRIRAVGQVAQPQLPYMEPLPSPTEPEPVDRGSVYTEGRWTPCSIFARERLVPGHVLHGPAVITQEDATTWLPPAWTACVDGWYNVVAQRSQS